MAESTDNVITHGLSGLIGKMLVFRRFYGKTIVARRPKKFSGPVSIEQEQIRSRFKEAAAYAKHAILDPEVKAAYTAAAKPGQTAYNMAFADFFNPPVLSKPEVDGYTGQAGERVAVRAVDNFLVQLVSVKITAAGTVLEEGPAGMGPNGLDWEYTTTAANAVLSGTKIVFTAVDVPGNESVLEVLIP